jgi:signal transduction histidine kinase/CheY-like chemotaxis protein
MTEAARLETAVLILAPAGRDAALAAGALERAGIGSVVCEDGDALCVRVAVGAGAAVVAEEALTPPVVEPLARVLAAQLPWSDFPLIILTGRDTTTHESRRVLDDFGKLGNVTALERPLHPRTLLSAVRAALRARDRQYLARAAFEEREREVRQRDEFLAMLGHELRNPLGAISNATELVKLRSADVGGLARPVAVIDRQIHNLMRLVDDLLDVARVTSGKIALQRAPTDLGALCRGLVAESLGASRDRGLVLELVAPPRPVRVFGDRVRLEQVVTNLLTNALKYTPAGGRVTVTVAAEGETDAVVRVADTGAGISADVLPTIFEPFTQSQRTLDRAQGGMGLGLNVVRALVRLHGGTVTAASPGLGLGTTFVVRLPLAPAEAPAAEDLTPHAERRAPQRTVLVVEDAADNRETLQDLIETFGHIVHVACDGLEGVEKAIALQPDVALVDIGLPHLDGYEVARRVRPALGRSVMLVALTGYGQPEDRAQARAAGFDAHLTKPLDIDALEDMLETLTANGSATRHGHAQRAVAGDVLIDGAAGHDRPLSRIDEVEAVAKKVDPCDHLK